MDIQNLAIFTNNLKNKFANFVELSIAKKTFLIERAIHIKLFHAQFC